MSLLSIMIRRLFDQGAPDQPAFMQKGPGAFFGEMALLTAEPRNAYVRSVDTLEVFVLSKANLQKVLLNFPDLEAVSQRSTEPVYQ